MFLKTNKNCFNLALTFMALMLLQAGTGFAEPRVRIDVERETQKKVTVAITDFVLKDSGADIMGIGKEAKKILENDLLLSEWFTSLQQTKFEELEKMEATTSTVDYRSWRQVGAQWLIKVEYRVAAGGKGQAFTFRLYDAVNKRFLLGKRYNASHDLLRKIIHRFADEVVMQLTGKRGIAETQIAFLSQDDSGKEVYRVDFDGHNLRQLTNDKTVNLSPAWSPDANWITYTSYAAHNPDLIMVDTAGAKRQTLHRLPGLNTAATWSPDMQNIALVLSRDQNSEIYILNKNHQLKRLTHHFNIDTSPSWSPDGKKIAFTSDRSGTGAPQIYIMNSDEGDKPGVTRISFGTTYNDNPAWSPNGDQIAYTSREGRQFQIRLYNLNTKKSEVMTTGSGSCEQPSWSPDGRFLIYRQRENSRYNLIIQRVGSAETRQLTFSGTGQSPAWSPYFKH
jgi:TolB protein